MDVRKCLISDGTYIERENFMRDAWNDFLNTDLKEQFIQEINRVLDEELKKSAVDSIIHNFECSNSGFVGISCHEDRSEYFSLLKKTKVILTTS